MPARTQPGQTGGAGATYSKAKKGVEENILKPGYSINPETVLGSKPRQTAAATPEENGPMVVEDPEVLRQAGERELLDFDTLKNQLIEQYKTQNRSNMATWLGMLQYNETAKSLDITVDAKAQETEISGERPALLYHFRHGMGVPELQLNIALREVQKADVNMRKMYTAKEKFDYMAAKNPNLEILRSTFGLEIDF